MNLQLIRMLKLRGLYSEPAGDEGSDNGGTDTGETGEAGEGDQTKGDEGKNDEGKGNAKPSDAEAKLLKDLMKHKAKAEAAATELQSLKAQLEALNGLGGVEKLKALVAAHEAEETKRLEAKGEYDRLIKQMGEKHTAERSAWQAQIDAANAAANAAAAQIAEITVGAAFAGSEFIKEGTTMTPRLARVAYGSHFEFKDGVIVAYDKPAGASERTVLVDSNGTPLSFDKAIEQLINAEEDRDALLRSKAKKGAASGTLPGKVDRSKLAAADKPTLNSTEKIAAGLRELAGKK